MSLSTSYFQENCEIEFPDRKCVFAEGQGNHAKLNENVLKLFLFPLSGDT